MDGQRTGLDNLGWRWPVGTLGMHAMAKYVIDMVKDHFVIEHGGLSLGICRPIQTDHTLKAAPHIAHIYVLVN